MSRTYLPCRASHRAKLSSSPAVTHRSPASSNDRLTTPGTSPPAVGVPWSTASVKTLAGLKRFCETRQSQVELSARSLATSRTSRAPSIFSVVREEDATWFWGGLDDISIDTGPQTVRVNKASSSMAARLLKLMRQVEF